MTRDEYFRLQGTSHPEYREPQDIEPGSKIVCTKDVANTDAHVWTLKGSHVFHQVWVCEYGPGTLRIEGTIRPSFIAERYYSWKRVLPQFEQFEQTFFAGLINTGEPEPVDAVRIKAEDFLNVICKIERLKTNSLQFMLDQFISKEGESNKVTLHSYWPPGRRPHK